MGMISSLLANTFRDSSSLIMGLLVFLAAGTMAFAAMAFVRVRGAVKRRTSRIMDDGERGSRPTRSLRYSSLKAVTRLLEYTTKHYAGDNDANTKVLRRRLIQAGIYDPRGVAFFFIARTALAIGLAVALFLFLPRQLLAIFGMHDPVVVGIGVQLLHVLSLSGLFIAVALTYSGGLQGTGDTKSPLYISIISQVALPLGICYVIRQTGTLHPINIWIAILIGHATRCGLTVLRFNQGKWRNIAVNIRDSAGSETSG